MDQNPHKSKRASGQMHDAGVWPTQSTSVTPMVPNMKQFRQGQTCDIVNGESTYKGERRDMDTDKGSN